MIMTRSPRPPRSARARPVANRWGREHLPRRSGSFPRSPAAPRRPSAPALGLARSLRAAGEARRVSARRPTKVPGAPLLPERQARRSPARQRGAWPRGPAPPPPAPPAAVAAPLRAPPSQDDAEGTRRLRAPPAARPRRPALRRRQRLTLQNHLFEPKGAPPTSHPSSLRLTDATASVPSKILFKKESQCASGGEYGKLSQPIQLPFPVRCKPRTPRHTRTPGRTRDPPRVQPALHDAPPATGTRPGRAARTPGRALSKGRAGCGDAAANRSRRRAAPRRAQRGPRGGNTGEPTR